MILQYYCTFGSNYQHLIHIHQCLHKTVNNEDLVRLCIYVTVLQLVPVQSVSADFRVYPDSQSHR